MVDWLNELREGIVEAYSGIIQGLKGEDAGPAAVASLAILEHHVPVMAQFLTVVARDTNKHDKVLSGACGLVGLVFISRYC